MDIIETIYKSNKMGERVTNEELYQIINSVNWIMSYQTSKRIDLTPLEIEILMNNKKEVLNIINKGINLNEISPIGVYPLELAIFTENYELVKLLIEKGANVNLGSKCFPLNITVNHKITKLLLENGADINALDKEGFNALHYLLNDGRVHITGVYLCDFNTLSSIMKMRKNPNTEEKIKIMDLLIKYGIDVNCVGRTVKSNTNEKIDVSPLAIALETSHPKIIKKLIDCGAERKVVEIDPTSVYAYQDSFSFIQDIKDRDLSLWPDAPIEYIRYLQYRKNINKFDIEVYSSTFDDGYRRPKMIKRSKIKNNH